MSSQKKTSARVPANNSKFGNLDIRISEHENWMILGFIHCEKNELKAENFMISLTLAQRKCIIMQ